jgi:hypothetical protein
VGAENFGRNIGDQFKHSWRPIPSERWVWVTKPMVMGAREFPTRLEEIRIFGHKAHQVFRVCKPLPLSRSFASTLREGGMSREYSSSGGGGFKWLYTDERSSGHPFDELGRQRQGEEIHREQQHRDRMFRERPEVSKRRPWPAGGDDVPRNEEHRV